MKSIKYLTVLAVAVPLVLGIGCKKKEEAVQAPPAEEAPITVKKEEIVVMVPDAVKGKWKNIKIEVLNKQTNQKSTIVVPMGSEVAVPGSKMKVKAENFLPEFKMEGSNVTSASNDPKNPAAQIVVTEDGKEVFSGWLFTLYPSTHPFEHPNYSLTLVGYTPAS
ncbi:MAG: DUF2155 domain-containing protein [Deltaproteobacteria bacterium]|nr:DUF2155 domain-containing protein [Deltaproteobacteria bacterium]